MIANPVAAPNTAAMRRQASGFIRVPDKASTAAPDDPRMPLHPRRYNLLLRRAAPYRKPPCLLCKIAKALKPGGRVAVVDFYEKPLPVGPPPSTKISDKTAIKEWQKAGFKLTKRLNTLPY